MPVNQFQIALEHHRNGRLQQAEAGYRAALEADAGNADALHWLGVLYYQASQPGAAIAWLKQAVAMRRNDPAFQSNLGQAYLSAGQKDLAIMAFNRAVSADPTRGEAGVDLAMAYLSRGRAGDAGAAVSALRKAQSAGVDSYDLHHHLGVALLASAQPRDAMAELEKALAKKKDDPSTIFHLALALRTIGDIAKCRECLEKAVELKPDMAQAWCVLASMEAEAGELPEAAGSFRKAIAAKPNLAMAYVGLSRVLEEMGKKSDAKAAARQAEKAARGEMPGTLTAPAPPASVAELERSLVLDSRNAQAHFAMATMMKIFPPAQVPAETVAGFFDKYAPRFDQHLRGTLEYRTPELVAEAVRSLWDGKPMEALDLGCGTGLLGPLIRPMASTLAGVDLSPAMVEKARERTVYDRLTVGDLVHALRCEPGSYDLLCSADVLIYLGDLAPTFEAAAAALRPGGMFAFTVEAGTGDRYALAPRSRRYVHSQPYLLHLASIFGFEEKHFSTVELRKESDKPVTGFLVVLRLPGA